MSHITQIKAILKRIDKGEVKNVFAALAKVKSLKREMVKTNSRNNWNKFLSQ